MRASPIIKMAPPVALPMIIFLAEMVKDGEMKRQNYIIINSTRNRHVRCLFQ